MTAQTRTLAHQMAELKLGADLEQFVRTRRADGRSWRLVERDLYEATAGAVDVTFETLRTWFPDSPAGAA